MKRWLFFLFERKSSRFLLNTMEPETCTVAPILVTDHFRWTTSFVLGPPGYPSNTTNGLSHSAWKYTSRTVVIYLHTCRHATMGLYGAGHLHPKCIWLSTGHWCVWGITEQLILEHFGQVIFAMSCCHKSLEEKLGININGIVYNIDGIAVAEGEYLFFLNVCFPYHPFQYLPTNLSCTVTIHCRISCDPWSNTVQRWISTKRTSWC